ncbi:MAG TPA: hypothetical protein VJ768_06470 [Anaerolineales bacterium]|nr:hypothetical protein [Anaerolineales bacterium]
MDPETRNKIENLLEEAPERFPFPATPEIYQRQSKGQPARTRRTPRIAWAIALVILLAVAAMAVPPVRAAVLEFIQLGAIRIFLGNPTPPVESIPTAGSPVTPSPVRTGYLAGLLALGSEVTLEEAEGQAGFQIPLPFYPSDLGKPDRVLLPPFENGSGVVLIWMDDRLSQDVRMSLILLSPGAFVGKDSPATVEEITVRGLPGLWLSGKHSLIFQDEVVDYPIDVFGNVLIWEEGGITYRMELNGTLDEALRIAESLR